MARLADPYTFGASGSRAYALQQSGTTRARQSYPIRTSESTGRPISALATGVRKLFWMAFTMRDHLWHRRDFMGKLAAVRPDREAATTFGATSPGWGPPVDLLYPSGVSALLHSRAEIAQHVKWLQQQDPTYILSLPSNIMAVAKHCLAAGVRFPGVGGSKIPRLVGEHGRLCIVQPLAFLLGGCCCQRYFQNTG